MHFWEDTEHTTQWRTALSTNTFYADFWRKGDFNEIMSWFRLWGGTHCETCLPGRDLKMPPALSRLFQKPESSLVTKFLILNEMIVFLCISSAFGSISFLLLLCRFCVASSVHHRRHFVSFFLSYRGITSHWVSSASPHWSSPVLTYFHTDY